MLRWLAMAKTFREMVVWQLAFEIQEKTNALLKTGPASRDFKFRDQLSDSVRSVPANIAEGFGRYGPAEIMRFVDFARASLDETESHFREAVARSYFPAEEVAPLIRLIARCRTGLARWHSYLRTVKKSPRFHR